LFAAVFNAPVFLCLPPIRQIARKPSSVIAYCAGATALVAHNPHAVIP
jgi:hypothetical protein